MTLSTDALFPSLAVGHEPEGEARLEASLAERAIDVLRLREECTRLQRLLRDALGRFESLPPPIVTHDAAVTRLAGERDAAVARALDAEAARTEATFRYDELAGHLLTVEGGLPGERVDVTCARLVGTVRGLNAALGEAEESRDLARARLMLTESDLDDARALQRALERELAEARDRLELEGVKSSRLAEQLVGAIRLREASELRGELAGLHARAAEAERALATAQSQVGALREQRRAVEQALASERDALSARLSQLERAIAREVDGQREPLAQLQNAEAGKRELRDELARAAAEATTLRSSLQTAELQRSSALTELWSERANTAEQQERSDRLAQALREVRGILLEFSSKVDRAGRSSDEPRAQGASSVPPRRPAALEAIEVLEERVAEREQHVQDLEARLARASAVARHLSQELVPGTSAGEQMRELLTLLGG